MPNMVAVMALLMWPLVAWGLYRRLEPGRALIWTILGGYLALPPLMRFDLPGLPDLDKFTLPSIIALLLSIFVLRDRIGLPRSMVARVLMALFVFGPVMTVATNGDAVGLLQGMQAYDAVSAVMTQAIVLLPFLLARRYLATEASMRDLAVALVVAGLVYSIPMLVEVRLSPQINVWVYGFFQHDFDQMMRFGGFRPLVFLPHGLWAAFFALMCYLSALMLAREAGARQHILAAVYLLGLLVACKSAGPLAYGAALTPVVLLAPRRGILMAAAVLALLALTFPVLRGTGLFPVEWLVSFASGLNADRAGSLAFRFANEDVLLDHAWLRPWFGWGGYGRHLLHDAGGRALTISDGGWIIAMGVFGWVGFVAQFGLLALPVLRLMRAEVGLFTCLMALILGANMVDLLPNATLTPFTWLLAGALLGRVEALVVETPRILQVRTVL